MAVDFNKFNTFVLELGKGTHNFPSDTVKVVLSNSAPSAANTKLSDITQISGTNGYTTGGSTATVSSWTQSSGTAKLILADVTFSASGSVGPFRYAVLYNDTAPNDELIGWYDYGSALTMANSGDQFVVDFDGSNGVLTIT